MSDFVINNSGLLTAADGTKPDLLAAKMGLAPYLSKWDFFALQGRMFNMHEVTIGTALTASAAAAAAITLTAPTLRFTVPSGTTVFPYNFHINLVSAAGTAGEMALVVSDTDSYTSGGTALASVIENWRTDDPAATSVTNAYHCSGSAIIEAALTNPRKFWTAGKLYATAAVTDEPTLYWEKMFPDLIPIVGPASVLLFISAVTTAATYEFDMSWAEVPTVNVV